MTAPTATVERKKRDPRTGLKMSASLATVFTILGHTVFGFDQPVSQVFVALITGYSNVRNASDTTSVGDANRPAAIPSLMKSSSSLGRSRFPTSPRVCAAVISS